MLLMMLASHISFGYCCCHYKLGSTVVTWQEGTKGTFTVEFWVDLGSSKPSTTLGEVGAKESQWLRTDRSTLISQLLLHNLVQ